MANLQTQSARGEGAQAFLAARDFLFQHREDYETAYREFHWPSLSQFNWAIDYFDDYALGNRKPALWLVEEDSSELRLSFEELSRRSSQVANFLRRQGVRRGDRVIVMLPNVPGIWEVMLAGLKLGAILIPAATLLTEADLRDRLDRGQARHVIAINSCTGRFVGITGNYTRIAYGGTVSGWSAYEDAYIEPPEFVADTPTNADDPFLLYFTSGTTALPKLVLHTHQSYPVGHLATMYWIGLQPDDVHFNISSPGWAKHAWSSFFAPWNAGATTFAYNYARFEAKQILRQIERCAVTSLCAPPTVWRMLVLEDLKAYKVKLRTLVSAGEPLNPEVIEKVRAAWGITIRDGFGQTESVLTLGNFPGQKVKPGAVGKPSPGHKVVLLDPSGRESNDGEICLKLNERPLSLMQGYMDDSKRTAQVMEGGYYRTGDVAHVDEEGYFTYIGRSDDVFKSSDYRVSPFELESALIEHPDIAEAAVVPSPDPLRWNVPKAFLTLRPGVQPTRELAKEIFVFIRGRLGPYKRVRRIEFSALPKTISGKIRRVQLRAEEQELRQQPGRRQGEYWEEDFPEPK